MAKIYEPTQTPSSPFYLGLSNAPRSIPADTTIGDALKNVASLFDQAVTGIDTANKEAIEQAAYTQLDTQRRAQLAENMEIIKRLQGEGGAVPADASGTPATTPASAPEYTPYDAPPLIPGQVTDISSQGASLLPPSDSAGVPAGIPEDLKPQISELHKIRALRDAQKLRPIQYRMHTDSILSNMKSRYPGYSRYIDRVGASILGHNPANSALEQSQALIKSLLTERKSEEDKFISFVRRQDVAEVLGEEGTQIAMQAARTGNLKLQTDIQAGVAKVLKIRQDKADLLQDLKLRKERNELNQDIATESATNLLRKSFAELWEKASLGSQLAGKDINTVINVLGSEGIKDPVLVGQALQVVNTMIRNYDVEKYRILNSPQDDGKGGTIVLGSILAGKKELIAGLGSQEKALLEGMRDAITNEKYGLAAANARQLKAITESDTLRAIASSKAIRTMNSLKETIPPELWKTWRAASPEGRTLEADVFRSLRDMEYPAIATGQTRSLLDIVNRANQAEVGASAANDENANRRKKSEHYKDIINNSKALLAPGMDPQVRANAAKFFANDDNAQFLKVYNPEQRYTAWANLSSPDVVQNMKGTADWASYRDWNIRTFGMIFKDYARMVESRMDEALSDPRAKVMFNPKTMQIEYQTFPGEVLMRRPDSIAIDNINTGLRTLKNVIEADGGDVAAKMQEILKGVRLDFNPKRDSMLDKVNRMFAGDPSVTVTEAQGEGEQKAASATAPTPVNSTSEAPSPVQTASLDQGREVDQNIADDATYKSMVDKVISGRTNEFDAREYELFYRRREQLMREQGRTSALGFQPEEGSAIAATEGQRAISAATSGKKNQVPLAFQDNVPLTNVIGKAESRGGDYNIILGGEKADLTNMTIADVYKLQRQMVRSGKESSAVGKYQTISSTLRRAVKALGLDPNTTPFDENVQEAIGNYLIMKDGGGERYLAGKITKEQFADRLAKVWAGLPTSSGGSAYAGVGSNKATVSRRALMKGIDAWTENNRPTLASGATEFSSQSRPISSAGQDTPPVQPVELSNITDLDTRPIVDLPDGSKGTVRSFSINEGDKEVLIPQIVGGKLLSTEEAVANYRKTGEHLGKFNTPAEATAYSKWLSNRQDRVRQPDRLIEPPRNPARLPEAVEGAIQETIFGPIADVGKALRGELTDAEAQDFLFAAASGILPIGRAGKGAAAVEKVLSKGKTLPFREERPFLMGERQFLYDIGGDKEVEISLSIKNNGKELYVEMAGFRDKKTGRGSMIHQRSAYNQIGLANMRSVLRTLKEQFPEAEVISGLRVGGARARAAEERVAVGKGYYEKSGHASTRLRPATGEVLPPERLTSQFTTSEATPRANWTVEDYRRHTEELERLLEGRDSITRGGVTYHNY